MLTVGVEIVRPIDTAQPVWVECELQDAFGRKWVFRDKVPIFTSVPLDADSSYPQPGVIACEIVREWIDERGRKRCAINTEHPWGIAAESGKAQFEVFCDQLTEQPD
jgi:hypothetical protein